MRTAALSLVLASLAIGCAREPPREPFCGVLEQTEIWRSPAREQIAIELVVDTHREAPGQRDATAQRIEAALVRLFAADTRTSIGQLDVVMSTAAPGCGEPARLTWRLADGASEPLAAATSAAVRALPTCTTTTPLLAALALPATDAATRLLVIVTDEDEPGALDRAETMVSSEDVPDAISLIAGIDSEGCREAPFEARSAATLEAAIARLEDAGAGLSEGSICASGWDPMIDPVVPGLVDIEPCYCLTDAAETAECRLVEHLAPDDHGCDSEDGRAPLEGEDDACLLAPIGSGWSTASPACEALCPGHAVSWLGARPRPGATIELRCVWTAGECGEP